MNSNLTLLLEQNIHGVLCCNNTNNKLTKKEQRAIDTLVKHVTSQLFSHPNISENFSIYVQNFDETFQISIFTDDCQTIEIENTQQTIHLSKKIFNRSEERKSLLLRHFKKEQTPLLPIYQKSPFPIHNRLIEHIHADEFGKSSQLEGIDATEALRYVCLYFKQRSHLPGHGYGISDDFVTSLSFAIVFSFQLKRDLAGAQQMLAEQLSKGKTFVIKGGWTGVPTGHIMQYEIIPQKDGTCNLRLYNRGVGLENHFHAQVGVKTKFSPVVEWRGIPTGRLLSADFIAVMKELTWEWQYPEDAHSPTRFGPKDIYGALLEICRPSEIVVLPESDGQPVLMTPQKSGVCGMASIYALARMNMTKNDYKRFKCDIRLQSLVDLINNPEPTDYSLSEAGRKRLVQKSLAKLSRSIDRLYKEGIVGQEYVNAAANHLQPVYDFLKVENAPGLYEKIAFCPTDYNPPDNFTYVPNQSARLYKVAEGIEEPSASYIFANAAEKLRDLSLEPKDISASLSLLHEISEGLLAQGNDIECYMVLTEKILRLPRSEDFWLEASQNNPQKAKSLISQIGSLQQLYFKACLTAAEAQIVFPEKVLVFVKTMYMNNILAQIIVPEWQDVKPYDASLYEKIFTFQQFSLKGMYFQLFDPQAELELKELCKWLAQRPKVRLNPELVKAFPYVLFTFDKYSLPFHGTVTDILTQSDPAFLETISAETEGFDQLAEHQRYARIYTSDKLPAWFTALRNGSLCYWHLAQDAVTRQMSLDPKKEISFDFRLEERDHDESRVLFSFSGISLSSLPVNSENTYPKFEAPKLNQFLHEMKISDSGQEERWLVTGKGITSQFSRQELEEYKELAYTRLSKELCLPLSLEFFEAHRGLLLDADYQKLFQMIFFQPGLLVQALKKEGFGQKLQALLNETFQACWQDSQIESLVFILRIRRYLEAYGIKNENDAGSILRACLHFPNLDVHQKSLLYAELIASFGAKAELSVNEVEQLLIAHAFLTYHPLPDKWSNEYIKKEIAQIPLKHASGIKKVLGDAKSINHGLLNQIMLCVDPMLEPGEWVINQKAGFFPEFHTLSSSVSYYPLSGRLSYPEATVHLPEAITSQNVFRQLFHVGKAVQLPGNIFSFEDHNGIPTLIQEKPNGLSIEQKRGEPHPQWHRHIPASNFFGEEENQGSKKRISHLISMNFLQNYTLWENLESTPPSLLLADPETGENIYRVRTENVEGLIKIKEIERLRDGAKLSQPSAAFTQFEDTNFIHEWYIDGQLAEVEFPRYGLHFTASLTVSGRLASVEHPGFCLDVAGTIPMLRDYNHYLLMVNEKGAKKAILPIHHFNPPKDKKEVYEIKHEIELHREGTEKKRQHCHIYDLHQDKLVTKSREGNLYLAEILLLSQDYKQAAYYLKKYGPKLSRYSNKESEILEKIAQIDQVTGNIEGNAWGVQALAIYLLIKNRMDFPVEGRKEQAKEMQLLRLLHRNYSEYLGHLKNIRVLQLSRAEEFYILKLLGTSGISFSDRLQQLTHPHAILHQEIPKVAPIPAFQRGEPLDFTSIIPGNPVSHDAYMKQHFSTLITRAFSRSYKFDFVGTYAFIFQYPYYLSQIKDGLIFQKHNAFSKDEELKAILLLLVADHVDKFPPLRFGASSLEIKKWWPQVLKIAAELSEQHPISVANPPILSIEPFEATADLKKMAPPATSTPSTSSEEPAKTPKRIHFNLQTADSLVVPAQVDAWFIQNTARPETSSAAEQKKPLPAILDGLKCPDPLILKVIGGLEADLQAFESQPSPPHYLLKEGSIEEIKKALENALESDKQEMKLLEERILKIARQKPSTRFGKNRFNLLKWGGEFVPLKLEELILNFGKQDASALQDRNPALLKDDIKSIYECLGEYLVLATRWQQAERALKAAHKIEALAGLHNSLEEKDQAVQQLAAGLTTIRCYQPAANPAFLVFEYFADILMRQNQVEMMENFLKAGDASQIKELIMGAGKSKVLLPLLALLRADGQALSMLVVPEPLFQSVASDTQTSLRDAFGKELVTFTFDRNTNFDLFTLENILDEVKRVRDEKKCLIITSKSIQCLMLRFLEKSINHFERSPADMPAELKIMKEILGLLSRDGRPLLDEVDLLLSPLHEVSFSLGEKSGPKSMEIEVISHLYELLYADAELKRLARLETDPHPHPKAPALTEQLYHEKIKEPLAKAFVHAYKNKKLDSALLPLKINQFFRGLAPNDEKLLIAYLCRTKGKEVAAQAFYNSLDGEVRELLAMAGEEISVLLPHTLVKPCDEKYGVPRASQSPEALSLLAVPFSAANTPNVGSEFVPHVTMNFTFQNYVKKGIPKHILAAQIQRLQESARQEIKASGGEKSLEHTAAWSNYQKLCGDSKLPFLKLNNHQLNQLEKIVNANPATRLLFVRMAILPQMVVYNKKISSNSHNFASFFQKLSGFSGTLNEDSLHRKFSIASAKGTLALTITQLYKNSYYAVDRVEGGSISETLEQLKNLDNPFDVVIDAGGYLKEADNETIAKELGNITDKSSVYYNSLGDQVIWDKKTNSHILLCETTIRESERVTFIDQSHTTGGDVPQKSTAVGYLTVGADMDLRKLLQSAWRLRGLSDKQTIRFLVSRDVEAAIRQTVRCESSASLTFADILAFCIHNQAKQWGKENSKAFHQELEEVCQKILLDTLLDPQNSPQACAKVVEAFGATWMKDANASAEKLYGTIPLEISADEIRSYLANSAAQSLPEEYSQEKMEIEKIFQKYAGCLPAKGYAKLGIEGQTIEQEQQKMAEKQSEMQQMSQGSGDSVELAELVDDANLTSVRLGTQSFSAKLFPEAFRGKYKEWRLPSKSHGRLMRVIPLPVYFEKIPELQKYSEVFEGINISFNMLQIPDKMDLQTADLKFFGFFRKPIHYMLIEKDGHITLINHREAERRSKKNFKNLYNLHLGYMDGTKQTDQAIFEKIVKIKFLNGESNYNRQELEILENWINQVGVQKMHDLFTKFILQGSIKKAQVYEQSSLYGLFQRHSLPLFLGS